MPVSGAQSVNLPCASCCGETFKPALECEGFSFVRCVKCSLVQRNPRFSEDEIIARYKSVYGNEYLSYELENEDKFLNLQLLALADVKFGELEKTLFSRSGKSGEFAENKFSLEKPLDLESTENKFSEKTMSVSGALAENPAVLDIGCATGALLSHLRGRGWRVTGVEISPSAVYAQKERSLDVKNIPLEECNFPSESFDVIHASHLIEHLNDPKSFLLECSRIIKKDGTIFITTPNIAGFQARLFGSAWRSAIFDHLYLFSVKTLTKLLKTAGFKKIKCKTWGGIAAGAFPSGSFLKNLKKPADRLVKIFNCGDVMIIRAMKI